MSNELSKPNQGFRPKVALVGLAAKKAALAAEQASASNNAPPRLTNPEDALHKIGIIFDDSGSMEGSALKNAKAGVEEFLRSCVPNQTAVAIYPMNAPKLALSSDLIALSILVQNILATGGTFPMRKLNELMCDTTITRAIIFSDGSPSSTDATRSDEYATAIKTAQLQKIPVDTVFIGIETGAENDYSPDFYLKQIAAKTGGIYLNFNPNKSNFATAFKYLSPGSRHMLADKSFVDKIQNGGV